MMNTRKNLEHLAACARREGLTHAADHIEGMLADRRMPRARELLAARALYIEHLKNQRVGIG